MNTYIILFLVGFFSSMTILTTMEIVNGQAYEDPNQLTGKMYEDQIIVCVTDLETENKNDHICHLYNADDLDYYQDSRDGSFFNLDDSFDMRLVD